MSIEVADTPDAVMELTREVATLQAQAKAVVHRMPQARMSAAGG